MNKILFAFSALFLAASAQAATPQLCGNQSQELRCAAAYEAIDSSGNESSVTAYIEQARFYETNDIYNLDSNSPCEASLVLGPNSLQGDPATGIFFTATYRPINENTLYIYMIKDGNRSAPIENTGFQSVVYTRTVDVNKTGNVNGVRYFIKNATYSCVMN